MGITLIAGDKQFDVKLLDDVLPGSSGIKVEANNNQTLQLSVGSAVTLQGDTSAGGDYTVAMALAPAAPRGWRLYLNQSSSGAVPVAASAPTTGASSSADNTGKLYEITYTGALGPLVRTSVQKVRVPFSRLSSEYARISRSGNKIVGVTEVV